MRFQVVVLTFAALVLFAGTVPGPRAESRPPAVREALARAGDNAGELLGAYGLVAPDRAKALDFLIADMPERDLKTLTGEFLAENVNAAYAARETVPWGDEISDELFFNDVLPYANLNERRDAWRERFFREFLPLVKDCRSPGEAAVALNAGIFEKTGVVYSKERPKADQSPFESIDAGMASCTGLSILLVDACRALCVPARIAGTPLWTDRSGNHTWVEVWQDGWHCLGAAESSELDRTWFAGKAARQDASNPATTIYAVSYKKTDRHFPLVWDAAATYVPAVDVTARYAEAPGDALTKDEIAAALEAAPLSELLKDPETRLSRLRLDDVAAVRDMLWQKYAAEIRADETRRREFEGRQISYGGKTMRYVAAERGEKPENGWPLIVAMHGGGGAPTAVNDAQWEHMQIYYRDSVENGIYLAPRGVNDAWNLHWVEESFACYDRIIENLIVFADVDPNRVYLTGYSAGGDAAYQIPARAPDRWAAVAMSAGHPNGVSPVNFFNLGFLIQVGALDAAYDRNRVGAEYGVRLAELAAEQPGWYPHACFIHAGRAHGIVDRDPQGARQVVYADPAEWLKQGDTASTRGLDANSIHWLRKFTRDPLPRTVIWDAKTSVTRAGAKQTGFWPTGAKGLQNYWIALDRYAGDMPLQADRIVVESTPGENAVRVASIGNHVKLLLSEKMFDLAKPIRVTVEGRTLERKADLRLGTMIRTLLDRGDPNYVFPAALSLTKNPEGDWLLERPAP